MNELNYPILHEAKMAVVGEKASNSGRLWAIGLLVNIWLGVGLGARDPIFLKFPIERSDEAVPRGDFRWSRSWGLFEEKVHGLPVKFFKAVNTSTYCRRTFRGDGMCLCPLNPDRRSKC